MLWSGLLTEITPNSTPSFRSTCWRFCNRKRGQCERRTENNHRITAQLATKTYGEEAVLDGRLKNTTLKVTSFAFHIFSVGIRFLCQPTLGKSSISVLADVVNGRQPWVFRLILFSQTSSEVQGRVIIEDKRPKVGRVLQYTKKHKGGEYYNSREKIHEIPRILIVSHLRE